MGVRAAVVITAAGLAAGLVGFSFGGASQRGHESAASPGASRRVALTPALHEGRDPIAAATALGTEGEYVAAVDTLLKIEGRSRRSRALYAFYASLDRGQLATLVNTLLAGGEADPVLEQLNGNPIDVFVLVDRWVELDPDGVGELIVNGGGDGQDGLRTLALTFLANRDQGRVMNLLGGRDGIDSVSDEGLLYGMAISDPAAAIALFIESGMPSSWDAETVFGLAGVRAGEALEAILALRDEDVRNDLLVELFTEWGRAAPEAALRRALSLGESGLRAETLRAVIDGYAEVDPPAVAEATESLPNSVDARRMARIVASRWGRTDPEAALNWGARHLEKPAFRMLLKRYENRTSPALVMKLISAMDKSGREIFLSRSAFEEEGHFLQRVARRDPRAAFSWLVAHEGEELAYMYRRARV